MCTYAWNGTIKYDIPKIGNKRVERVEEKHILQGRLKIFYRIKNCRDPHNQLWNYTPQILHIAEENEQGRKDQPQTDIKQDEAANWV